MVQSFFSVAICSEIGNGANTLFGQINGSMDSVSLTLHRSYSGWFPNEEPTDERFLMF
jgi:hypothetical protein